MPKILEETEIKLDRADLLSRSPIGRPVDKRGRVAEPTRTKGIHLSGVLRYVAVESGLVKVYKDIEEEEMPLRMALGLAWEEFAVSLYPDIAWQPGEAQLDDIVMTCDGLTPFAVDTEQLVGWDHRLEEFKLTWKKRKSGVDLLKDEWYWMQQGRGYCWGYDARIVRWHICYVMGDYRGSGPIYVRYLIEFADKEIESTRAMILNNRSAAIEKGYCE